MRLALIQLDIAWENAEENRRRAEELLGRAAAGGARLAMLPEMFNTGFSMSPETLAEDPGGTTETFLVRQAGALGLWILGSIPEKGPEKPFNMAILASPSGHVSRYAKIHPFSPAGEARHYAAGDRVVTWPVDEVRVTPFICYDLRFPEAFRVAAAETDLFAVVANWPDSRREHWRTLLRARAIENQCYVAGVNRIGDGAKLHYAGDSAVVDPMGHVLVEGADRDALVFADVEPEVVAGVRARFPFLSDRNPGACRR